MSSIVSMTVECERQLVASEVTSRRTLEWVIRASAEDTAATRAPLNLALVLDRSGSMRGEKLAYVKQAARHVLSLLNEQDRVALVAYDDQVKVVAASQVVTEQHRQELLGHIDVLQPGGWTNLSGGWLAGCQESAAHELPTNVNRVLLLTDGLANRGILDVEELIHHARELRRRGITTSTFGVGLDFNEHLLEALATEGGGHFFYIEQPRQIPDVFQRELGELLTVVAREAFVSVTLPPGTDVELLGELPHERTGQHLRIFLGDLFAGAERRVYANMLIPPHKSGASIVITSDLSYADLDAHTHTLAVDLPLQYVTEAEVLRVSLNKELLERAGTIELATTAARALRLERAGQHRQAQALMQQSLQSNAAHIPAPVAAAYQQLAENLEQGLNEGQRKAVHFAAYKTRQSRD